MIQELIKYPNPAGVCGAVHGKARFECAGDELGESSTASGAGTRCRSGVRNTWYYHGGSVQHKFSQTGVGLRLVRRHRDQANWCRGIEGAHPQRGRGLGGNRGGYGEQLIALHCRLRSAASPFGSRTALPWDACWSFSVNVLPPTGDFQREGALWTRVLRRAVPSVAGFAFAMEALGARPPGFVVGHRFHGPQLAPVAHRAYQTMLGHTQTTQSSRVLASSHTHTSTHRGLGTSLSGRVRGIRSSGAGNWTRKSSRTQLSTKASLNSLTPSLAPPGLRGRQEVGRRRGRSASTEMGEDEPESAVATRLRARRPVQAKIIRPIEKGAPKAADGKLFRNTGGVHKCWDWRWEQNERLQRAVPSQTGTSVRHLTRI